MSREEGTATFDRIGTGIAGLDAVLGGGVPAGSITVIAGEPGAGKTVLALQMLFAAARSGKRSLYFSTLSEPTLKLVRHMQGFRFFDAGLLDRSISIVAGGSALRSRDPPRALATIAEHVERAEPAIVVVDSFKVMNDLSDSPLESRAATYDLAVQMAGWGATTLLVGEYTDEDIQRLPEFAIADGIIRLGTAAQELTKIRELEVRKLRGSGFVAGVHFFEISRDGMAFFPRVRAPEQVDRGPAATSGPPVSTGVPQLDALLAGGLPPASTTTLMGGTGTGKTVLGLQFLADGARRGEPGALLTLEETPEQIRSIAAGFRHGFVDLERQGLLHIRYTAPIELSTDRFLQRARDEIERLGVRRVVLDSLSSLSLGTVSERRYKELVYAFAKHMRGLGVTTLLTMEITELLGSGQLSGHGVSFASDNLIQLRYVELDGRLERALSIVKARGVAVNTELREMTIGAAGVQVSEHNPFKALRGVLTGLPEREGGGA
jgi:circadian clock protein KaiC